jgi:hypothetical protein
MECNVSIVSFQPPVVFTEQVCSRNNAFDVSSGEVRPQSLLEHQLLRLSCSVIFSGKYVECAKILQKLLSAIFL